MIAINELKGKITANGYTQGQISKKLGMTQKTFGLKLKRGILDSDEIETLIDVLSIEDPVKFFFAKEVTLHVTNDHRNTS
jgi:hypothetical protein